MFTSKLKRTYGFLLTPVDCASRFSLDDLPSDEMKMYRQLSNESFFYRGHPAALVTGVMTYFGIGRVIPKMPHLYKAITTFAVSLIGSWVARQSYLPTIQEKVMTELPPYTFLHQAVASGELFKPALFSSSSMQKRIGLKFSTKES
ncbi:unnamed protein product [Clavelina lepadiformis]|uniref:OCIA domain-containing protein n=1 Tax=Clavelina lepadiformis TaxID=159417 RepID=A0ABP0G037_CLALP